MKKQRHADINLAGPRLGFRTFQRFYALTTSAKQLKSVQDFIDSNFYIAFVKFGHHLVSLKPLHTSQFIDFIIKNGVPLKDWTKDVVYFTYLEDLIQKEPATNAATRTITNICEWCDSNSVNFSDFFSNISANEGAYMIKTGKISPWILYLSSKGGDLLNRLTQDHSSMVSGMIDAKYWMRKFKKNNNDVLYIQNILNQAGL
ncbi:MAG TPA: hypothetical protein VIY47_02020 [Ignavibacteriaceae bacterium]